MRSALKVAGRGCYAWKSRSASAHGERGLEPARMIGEGRGSGRGACGSPKIFRTLRRRGVRTSRKRAARIVAEYGRLRLADVTYARTHRGWLHLPTATDVWPRKVVGWPMGPRMAADLADDASAEPFAGIIGSECVHARTFAAREEATVEIFGHVGCFCGKRRIRSALGWLSPGEFESEHGKRRSEEA